MLNLVKNLLGVGQNVSSSSPLFTPQFIITKIWSCQQTQKALHTDKMGNKAWNKIRINTKMVNNKKYLKFPNDCS